MVITSTETTLKKVEQGKFPQNLPSVPALSIGQSWITYPFLTNLARAMGLLWLAQPSWDPSSRARDWVTVSWAYERSEVGVGVEKDDSSLALFNKSHPQQKDASILSTIQVLKLEGERRGMNVGGQPAWSTTKGKVSVRCIVFCIQ